MSPRARLRALVLPGLLLGALLAAQPSVAVAAPRCSGSCPQVALAAAEVERIVRQAAAEALANGVAATIAIVDHVGNVLAVYEMTGASEDTLISSQRGVLTGLEGLRVPAALAAISKAGTAAYLSTQGHAFSTRTASQIVQEHFDPGERRQPGGPLFGVQFSQLPCGDLVRRFGVDAQRGPKRMPLGFSGDPGGLPLYLDGVPVGGVGVESDGLYGIDRRVRDRDRSVEERVASAAARGFAAPRDRRADRIAVAGRLLRFADDERTRTRSGDPLPPLAALPGRLLAVPGFCDAVIVPGAEFLTPTSGIVRDDALLDDVPAEILVEAGGGNRHPPTDSSLSGGLAAEEVRVLLREALRVAGRTRAQIRRPLGSAARVTVSVVDTDGAILGVARSPDAPPFGIDVSLQKARGAAVLSTPTAAADLAAATSVAPLLGALPFSQYVADLASFTGGRIQLDGSVAFADRSIGNLSRPFFPDGIDGKPNGPLSKPFPQWSPFSTGLQLELVLPELARVLCPFAPDVQALLGLGSPAACPAPADPPRCSDLGVAPGRPRGKLPNGIQIFPGSVPIYRGDALVGGIGISGDGVDQDDLIAFLGLHEAFELLGTIANAPRERRADRVRIDDVNLRYVSCPPSPFRRGSQQNVCEGK